MRRLNARSKEERKSWSAAVSRTASPQGVVQRKQQLLTQLSPLPPLEEANGSAARVSGATGFAAFTRAVTLSPLSFVAAPSVPVNHNTPSYASPPLHSSTNPLRTAHLANASNTAAARESSRTSSVQSLPVLLVLLPTVEARGRQARHRVDFALLSSPLALP